MRLRYVISVLLFLSSAVLATTLERGVAPELKPENQTVFQEVYLIKVENRRDGLIAVSRDHGVSWQELGRVLYPADRVSKTGYAAAAWVKPGRVSATAVNAIHIKTGSIEVERTIFTLLPKEFVKPPGRYRSFLSQDSSIYTDIPAGTKIFGSGEAPFVGNVVLLSRGSAHIELLPEGFVPQVDDTFIIIVDRPAERPSALVFENRFGGRITLEYPSGQQKVVGEVLRPVSGIGRFEGSTYTGPGRIRANHAGVICVSVSPVGELGGFQIVPALHGQEMNYVKHMSQYMVVGPPAVEDPSLEGIAPFFHYYIQPEYGAADLEADDWQEKLLQHYLVEVKLKSKDNWQAMPVFALRRDFPLPRWANSAFDRVTHFRILFPVIATEK
ncbi:MAG: hypothetical protein JW782_03835 [Candidatus Saganbacteria bacterium]|nr:hypothetical protein [Candidatus Saganbacteria bacterium]